MHDGGGDFIPFNGLRSLRGLEAKGGWRRAGGDGRRAGWRRAEGGAYHCPAARPCFWVGAFPSVGNLERACSTLHVGSFKVIPLLMMPLVGAFFIKTNKNTIYVGGGGGGNVYTTLLCVSFSNDRAMECREVCDLELLLVPVSRWKRRPLHVMSQSTIIMALHLTWI